MVSSTPAEASTDGDAPAEEKPPQDTRGYHLEIFLISFAALLLEISYTRVVSFKLFYYYTYLVIGLALLGIGCGSVLTSISKRLKRAQTDTITPIQMNDANRARQMTTRAAKFTTESWVP